MSRANTKNMVWELRELLHAINAWEFLQTRPKPGKKSSRGRNNGLHIKNKTGTKQQNEGRAKQEKNDQNARQFRLKVR